MTKGIRLLVLGGAGQVGTALKRFAQPTLGEYLTQAAYLDLGEVDLANPDNLRQVMQGFKADVIINAAAYTNVDKAEDEAQLAQAINADAVGIIGEWCKSNGAFLVHYSTDYVYDGAASEPYLETAPINPQSVYGRTKALGDEYLAQTGCDYTTFRTSWVFGRDGDNFYKKIIRFADMRAKAGQPLGVVDDQTGAPTPAPWLAELALRASARRAIPIGGALKTIGLPKDLPTGVFHAAAAGQTTWFDYAKLAIDMAEGTPLLDKAPEVIRASSAQMNFKAKRPAYSVLNTSKLIQAFSGAGHVLTPPNWISAVTEALMGDIEQAVAHQAAAQQASQG